MNDSRLIDEPFVAYLPSLARDLGSPLRAIIMQTLWFARDKRTGLTEMTYSEMADATAIPDRTLRTHTKWLRDQGHLTTERKSTLDSTNVWRVTLQPPEVAESATSTDAAAPTPSPSVSTGRPDQPPLEVAESATPLSKNKKSTTAAAVLEEPSQTQAPDDDTPAGEAAATEPEPERDEFLVVPCDNDEPHDSHTWWTEAPPQGGYQYQRMCEGVTVEEIEQASRDIAAAAHAADIGLDEPAPGYPDGVGAAYPDQPAETMEQGVAIITETLGGQVIADSHGGNQHDPDGPRAQHHGGNRYTVADDPRVCPPFPQVVQHNLATWWGVDAQEGSLWEAAWQTADMATSRAVQGDAIFYDAETHLMSYLMRAKSEGRRPRHDLWVRFFIEDRAKHIQTLRANAERLTRQDEDPAEREMRSATTLPPDWGNQMEG